MSSTKAQRDEARARLLEWVKPGDTIYTQLKHVSRSGMLRVIQLVKLDGGQPSYLGYNAALACDMRYDRGKEGVRIAGCGMDMGFEAVYVLSHVLFGDGYALKQCWL